jgi:DNA polymerase-3 subunit beta
MTSGVFDIEVSVKDLVSALSVLTSVMERKSVNPILSCVKLDIEDNSLLIQATDGSIFVKQLIGAKIHNTSMSIAVEGRLMERMLKGLADETISMKYLSQSNELLISSPSFELKLVILSSDEFPKFPRVYTDTSFELPYKDLYNLINYTEFSSSKDEIRYNLNGVCLHSEGAGRICAASTDVFRLSTFFVDSPDAAKEFKIILPTKTVDFIRSLNSPGFENHVIKAKTNNNIIELSILNTLVVSKLIDGAFPDYQGLIPKNNNNKLVINKAVFAGAIERVAGITDEKSKAIKISIDQENIEIFAYTQSKGEAKQSINKAFFNYDGTAISVAFQPKYLLDVMGLFKAQDDVEVEFAFKDPSSPIVITCNKLENGLFVVMPIKI